MTNPEEPTISNRTAGGGYFMIPDSAPYCPITAEWIPLQIDPPIHAKIPTDPFDLTPIMIRAPSKLLSTLRSDTIRRLLMQALEREQ